MFARSGTLMLNSLCLVYRQVHWKHHDHSYIDSLRALKMAIPLSSLRKSLIFSGRILVTHWSYPLDIPTAFPELGITSNSEWLADWLTTEESVTICSEIVTTTNDHQYWSYDYKSIHVLWRQETGLATKPSKTKFAALNVVLSKCVLQAKVI